MKKIVCHMCKKDLPDREDDPSVDVHFCSVDCYVEWEKYYTYKEDEIDCIKKIG